MKKSLQIIIALSIGLLIGFSSNAFAEITQKVEAQFAKFRFIVDGVEKDLEADPLVYQGTTYLPVRVIANMLGKDVVYKADSRIIEINTPKAVDDMSENESILDGLINQPPEIIRGVIKALEADLSRESNPEAKKKIETDIEELKAYLKSIGEPVSDEFFRIKEQLEVVERNIESVKSMILVQPENEQLNNRLQELEAEKAKLEEQLQAAK